MNTPILIITFNRPHFLKKIVSVLKKIKPKKIYFKIDGPRQGNKNDEKQILKTKKIINKIQWKCKKIVFESKKNLGSRDNPTRGIDWLFSHEKRGIILEDDCIPNKSFFKYCEELLKKYENNNKISMISGRNNLERTDLRSSYYFTFGNTWGWATWRDVWKIYDKDIKFWPRFKNSLGWKKNFLTIDERRYWSLVFDACYQNKIDSWAYPWTLSLWKKELLTVTPSKNLVNNIGLTSTRTYFKLSSPSYKTGYLNVEKIKFNNNLKIDKKADSFIFINNFKGKIKTNIWKILRFFNYGV